MGITIFYIPFPTQSEAENAVAHLLEKRLIACGNVVESKSMYYWDNDLVAENEYIAIVKSVSYLRMEIEKEITDIHTYELPAILHWEVGANESYKKWVLSKVKTQ